MKIYQDKQKYIWIGTQDGLNRYDGYDIITYKKKQKDPTSLSSNYINDIIEDKEQRIWIATNYGLNMYDRKLDKFTRYMHDPNISGSISSNFIVSLHQDQRGNLWIGTSLGLNLFDKQQQKFKYYGNALIANRIAETRRVNCIGNYDNKHILVGTEGSGIEKFDIDRRKFVALSNSSLNTLKNYRINAIKKDLNDFIWIGSQGNGVFQYSPATDKIEQFQKGQGNSRGLSSNIIKNIICDHKNNIWLSTEHGGLNVKPTGNKGFISYENDQRKPFSFSSPTALGLMEDAQGNIWIGTYHGKVNIYSPLTAKFKNYSRGTWPGALSFNDIKTFCEGNNGEIWVGADGGGINVLNKSTGRFTYFQHSETDANSLSSNAVLDIKKDREGTIWVATWGGGLNRYNSKSRNFTRFLNDPGNTSSITSNFVFNIYPDKNGMLWVGNFYGGLNFFDPKTNSFKRILSSQDGKSRFIGNDVLCIHEDAYGALWISTLGQGLNYLTPDRLHFYHYFNDDKNDLRDAVRVIYSDRKKRLWAGKTGLYLFDRKKNKFMLCSGNPLLTDQGIVSIIEDKKGNLWLGSTSGLIQYNPDTKFIKQYTGADGLQGLEFNENAAFASKGEVFVGGVNGFNTFYPDSIKALDYSYPTYITDLSIFNKSIKEQKNGTIEKYIAENRNVVLDHNQSVISFEYAALNYVSPQKTSYAYQLVGFDKKWNYVGNQRRASYTNLDPGDYTFHVKSSSPDGLWNTRAASVHLTITPPFYLTIWFKTLAVIVLVVSVFLVLYYRRKAELRGIHEENKEKMYQLQLQFFTNISHEFRTPLTLIIGTLEQIFKLDPDSGFTRYYNTINRNANRLLHLISELMDFRKVESGVLKLKVMPGNFTSFLLEIVQDFKDQALATNISLDVVLDADYEGIWFDRQVVEKIILNLLNNAFKFTPSGGTISIHVSSSLDATHPSLGNSLKLESDYKGNNQIFISVSDTGIGISKESINHLFERFFRVSDTHLGSGIGLAFVKSLVFLHKGNIYVHSERHEGTQFTISLPCDKNDYQKDELWPEHDMERGVQIESIQYKKASGRHLVDTGMLPTDPIPGLKQSVLIVEDNEELRAYFKEILQSAYHIIEARNGAEGLQQAKETSPALIISDVMMPLMDGIDFCKHIKEDFETSHIPFILLTAKDALESRIEGVESGADYYFSKPVSTDLLILTIKNLFKQKQKIKERYLKDYQVEARDLVHTSKDKDFMDRLLRLIEEKLEEPDLNIDFVCREMGVSNSKLYKKIKDITGQGGNEFIRTIRLKKAVEIMTHEDVLITELMYRVGISSKAYFTNSFKKEFGMTPSQYQQQLDKKKPSKHP
nr:two-component regulator propeller domain-containing protein [Pedobacter frigiditerrae]